MREYKPNILIVKGHDAYYKKKGSIKDLENYKNSKNFIKAVKNARNYEKSHEKLVIIAQMLGLNSCWVALTYKKGKVPIKAKKGEKFYIVIAIGYGRNRGLPRKSKTVDKLCNLKENEMPEWFKNGMDFAMRAPTAINQQKFFISLDSLEERIVSARAKIGPCSKIDLGIVKYHFEIGAGKESFKWRK